MPGWAWAVIAVVAILVIVAVVAWTVWSGRRRERLRSRFGPEYESSIREHGSQRKAESDLAGREKRRSELEIRAVGPTARTSYAQAWQQVQVRFVDAPSDAVREADALVSRLMSDMGYPMGDFEQRSADISVDHANVVENYREAHGISMANDRALASTEDLRQATVHYRALFDDLLAYDQAPADPQESEAAAPEQTAAGLIHP
jgi:hypothetical protein